MLISIVCILAFILSAFFVITFIFCFVGNDDEKIRCKISAPILFLSAAGLITWADLAASQDYKVASIKICTTKPEGDKNYIEYASQRNKYTKKYVGNAPFYRVVEYEQYYYGILFDIRPDIVPGTLEELMLPKPQNGDLQTDMQKFMRVPLDKADT